MHLLVSSSKLDLENKVMRKALHSSSKEVYNLGGEKSIVYIVTQKVNNKRYYKEKLLCFSAQNHTKCFMYGLASGDREWIKYIHKFFAAVFKRLP